MSVCAETIYRACSANDARSGLAAGTWAKLPRRCRRRRPRSVAQAQKPSPLGEYRRLADRPAAAEDRMEPGHWEGDLIVGKANLTAAVTLAERTSRYAVTAALPDGYGAPQVAAAVAAALGRQPAALVRSLTWDQGREMARWADIEAALGIEVFFCEPRSPWQRPTNEQTNALLRRWLPKGTSLDIATAAALSHRGQPQPHAPPTPQLGISTRHLHSTQSQPPVELAGHPRHSALRPHPNKDPGRPRTGLC